MKQYYGIVNSQFQVAEFSKKFGFAHSTIVSCIYLELTRYVLQIKCLNNIVAKDPRGVKKIIKQMLDQKIIIGER